MAKLWVIKLGSSSLTRPDGRLDLQTMSQLMQQIAQIRAAGDQVVLVSSGAVAAGRKIWDPEHASMASKQALAALGQPLLMAQWARIAEIYDLRVAQVLLTAADLDARARWLLARNTLETLLGIGAIPIINENDTVAVDEMRFGDNDMLSARVAALLGADRLILLTDQQGLYSANPRQHPDAHLIRELSEEISDALRHSAGGHGGTLGTGGMASKLNAADLARHAGIEVFIAHARQANIVLELDLKDTPRTRFSALATYVDARKRYILAGGKPNGQVRIDAGAARALSTGASLLAVGVTACVGEFAAGDSIEVLDTSDRVLAHGLSHYSAVDVRTIMGQSSQQIAQLLGGDAEPLIHRNDMVLWYAN